MTITRTLYRRLLKAAVAFDRRPALKLALPHPALSHRVEAALRVARREIKARHKSEGKEKGREGGSSESGESAAGSSSASSSSDSEPALVVSISPSDPSRASLALSLPRGGAAHPRSLVARAAERLWRKSATPLAQAAYDEAFHGRLYLWPDQAAPRWSQIVARLARNPPLTSNKPHLLSGAHDTHAPDSQAAASSSSSAPSSQPLPASVLSDSFHMLRLLNTALSRHSKAAVPIDSPEVAIDPAFQAHVEQLGLVKAGSDEFKQWAAHYISQQNAVNAETSSAASTNAASSSSSSDASASDLFARLTAEKSRWDAAPSMQPTSELKPGVFLVAHPSMGGSFHRSVILLVHHGEDGTAGLVVNHPASALLHAVWKALPGGQRYGGPVSTPPQWLTSACVVTRLPTLPHPARCCLTMLHRLPALASVAAIQAGDFFLPLIDGPDPVFVVRSLEGIEATEKALSDAKELAERRAKRSGFFPSLSSKSSSSSSAGIPANVSHLQLVNVYGSAVWSPGQLEEELREGSWMLMSGSARHALPFVPEEAESEEEQRSEQEKEREKRKEKKSASDASAASSSDSSSDSTPSSHTGASSDSAPSTQQLQLPDGIHLPIHATHLWSHAMFHLGGEHRALARIEPLYDFTEDEADEKAAASKK